MIGQVQAEFHAMQTHHSVESSTTSEVQNCKGELLNRVVFHIDPVVGFIFELAHSHIGYWRSRVWSLGSCQMVSQKLGPFQLLYQICKQSLFISAVFSGDNDVHVSTCRFSSSIGATNLKVVHVKGGNQFNHHCFDEVEHLCYFLSRDLWLKLFMVF